VQLPPAPTQINRDQIVLEYSESDLLSQLQVCPAAERRKCETRIEPPISGPKMSPSALMRRTRTVIEQTM